VLDVDEPLALRYLPMSFNDRAMWLGDRFASALTQQFALQFFLLPVCLELTRSRWSGLVLGAAVFALLHLPHPVLVAAAFCAGLLWLSLLRRSRRLVPLVVSHLMITILTTGLFPNAAIIGLRVGPGALKDMAAVRFLARDDIRQLRRHVASNQYFAACGNDRAKFVTSLFVELLGRVPTDVELARRLDQMNQFSRAEVVRRFLRSDDFTARYASRPVDPAILASMAALARNDIADSTLR
jgi:hypothetical protein